MGHVDKPDPQREGREPAENGCQNGGAVNLSLVS